MSVAKSTAVQILMAWRDNKWMVLRDTVEIGAYAYRGHAMEMVRRLAAQACEAGRDCYLLVRERDGAWEERPCPKPSRSTPSAA